MGRYAEHTTVSSERSRAEIEQILRRYGATKFAYGWEEGPNGEQFAQLVFEAHNRRVRFRLPLPARMDDAFQKTPTGRDRKNAATVDARWEQACQRWRALALAIKTKLEAVECNITTFEQEFLAHIVIAGGVTLGEWATPQLARFYDKGLKLSLLPSGDDR